MLIKTGGTSFRNKVIWILFTLLICTILLEIGLRAKGFSPSNITDGFFERHGKSYCLKKNFTKIVNIPSYSCIIHTNSYGFRDKTNESREVGSRPYFVFLGESLTFGNGVDYQQSFVGLCGEFLEKYGFDTFNLAVGGHLFREQEDLFREFANSIPKKPSCVIICFSPGFIWGFDSEYSDIIIKDGYLFDRKNWVIPYLRVLFGNMSSAYCYFRDNIRKLQGELSHNNARIALQILDSYSKKIPLSDPLVAAKLEARLDRFDALVRSQGASLIYVYLPTSTDFSLEALLSTAGADQDNYDFFFYYNLLRHHCHDHQLPLVDLYPSLKALYDKGEKLSFLQDAHYNVKANHVIGETISRFILEKTELGSLGNR
jgi:hypothetical protein